MRAFDPVAGRRTTLAGAMVKLARRAVAARRRAARDGAGRGRQGIDVACGTGALRVVELQRAGGRAPAGGCARRRAFRRAGARFVTGTPAIESRAPPGI
ncbi:MAG: hypothetical protein MZW92_69160 [Comamonadaceae bacterium]|nr:hypothetical protein [Comamonadaceae bacterium]